ncbi:MAG: alpha/beta hydrolase family esterase, partial [Candidatus Limnocylindria bacterium]
SVPSAFAAMARGGRKVADLARPVPSIVIHGSGDRTVAPVNGDQVLAQSMAAGDLHIAHPTSTASGRVEGGHAYQRSRWTDAHGALMHELLKVEGMGHAWSGGLPGGSYTDPRGPDATEAIWSFFAEVGGR